jgi:TatD DNase family protein
MKHMNGGAVGNSLDERHSNPPLPIFDTHAHLDFPQFEPDRTALIRRLETGTFPGGLAPEELNDRPIEIAGVLIPGIDAASCQRAIEMPVLSDLFCAAVAIHPNHTVGTTEEDWHIIADLVRQENVVAVGETGLDRYWDDAPIEVQIDWFHRHLELSQETGKPILIHCRDAWDDLLPILHQAGRLCGVIHAFSGNMEQMFACVELGLHISFAGSVTYRNAKFASLWEAAQETPLDRLLIETDAPFMIPHPFRGKLPRNEPTLAALTALRLAELRKETLQTIAETTTHNANQLFGKDKGNS